MHEEKEEEKARGNASGSVKIYSDFSGFSWSSDSKKSVAIFIVCLQIKQ